MKNIKKKYDQLKEHLNEKTRRLWCATEAEEEWRWWISKVVRATWVSAPTIRRWISELKSPEKVVIWRIREKWWWRKKLLNKDSNLKTDLENLVEPATRWEPESPLKRTSKSTIKLASELNKEKHRASYKTVWRILKILWYSLQSNRKVKEWWEHPDRNEQFEYINNKTKYFQKRNEPVVSVDTKKKENIWNFKNEWKEYHKKWESPKVNVYDFLDKEKWKVSPYWVYDLDKNKWWVNVWISADTAEFSVNSIRKWWQRMWNKTYPKAKELYINADGWWSNWRRNRLWKLELQKFATETWLIIHVSHFPPWTSKWNKIEHKMFCFISKNWRGRPLIDTATVVNLIGNTKTKTGLTIEAELDENIYEKWIKVSDEELEKINIQKDDFHGEWNYYIKP